MRILLINPPFNRLKQLKFFYFPLGLGYVGAYLSEQGHCVHIYNADKPDDAAGFAHNLMRNKFDGQECLIEGVRNSSLPLWDEVRKTIFEYRPDVVGITSTSPAYPAARMIARIAKEVGNNARVVMGGMHATLRAEEVLRDGNVDYVVRGEGERSCAELMDFLAGKECSKPERIGGISFRNDNTTFHAPDRPLVEDLDKLPFSGRELLINPAQDNRENKTIIASRGCPYDCAYCNSAGMWKKKYRECSVDRIIEEMRWLNERYGVRTFDLRDETFTLSASRVAEFCQKVKKEGFHWSCDTRIDRIDGALLHEMSRAGCVHTTFGIESGSEESLKRVDKAFDLEAAVRKCLLTKRAGITVTINVMIGLPWEREEDLLLTEQFIKRVRPHGVCLSVFIPLPDSPLVRSGQAPQITAEQWMRYSFQSRHNFFVTSGMQRRTFESIRERMISLADEFNRSKAPKLFTVLKRKIVPGLPKQLARRYPVG